MKTIRSMTFRACASLAAALVTFGAAGQHLVGVDLDNGQGSPTNWNTFNMSTPGVLNNLIDESGAATSYSFTMNHGSPFTTAVNPVTVPQHSNPLDLIADYYFGTGIGTAQFSNLAAGQEYYVWVFGLRGFTMNNRITITGGGSPIHFDQVGTAGQLFVNGEMGDQTRTLQSYALVQTADASGVIGFTLDIVPGGSAGWTIAGFAIQAVPSPGALALLGVAAIASSRRRRRH